MGNKMCKKKGDNVDSPKSTSPSTFDRIITRLHLKPNSWKSDSQLSTKQVNRSDLNPKDSKNGLIKSTDSLSKSSEWSEAKLEVPEREAIHLKNPQLSFIFNDNTTPTPPPRKHKKSIREKIETVAKNSIQALQSIKTNDETNKKANVENLIPVNEVLCVKKVIYYGCPCGSEICNHLRQDKLETQKSNNKKESKRKKNLSVVSLPNYTELKLSLATDEDTLRYVDSSTNDSANSLPEEKQTGKLENYMTRCRSFGSLLNNKLKVPKTPADVESDDSFGGLEDWDLGILEHYNPKDASLPRTRKSKNNPNVLVDVEKLIVSDIEATETPPRPVRRSESIKKKAIIDSMEESIIVNSNDSNLNKSNNVDANVDLNKKQNLNENDDNFNTTNNNNIQNVKLSDLENIIPTESKIKDDIVEHSTLMKILQEYSIKDAQHRNTKENTSSSDGNNVLQSNNAQVNEKQQDCMNINSVLNVTTDFLNTERQNIS